MWLERFDVQIVRRGVKFIAHGGPLFNFKRFGEFKCIKQGSLAHVHLGSIYPRVNVRYPMEGWLMQASAATLR